MKHFDPEKQKLDVKFFMMECLCENIGFCVPRTTASQFNEIFFIFHIPNYPDCSNVLALAKFLETVPSEFWNPKY